MKRFPGAPVPSDKWFPDVGRFFPRFSLTIAIPAKPQAYFNYMNPAANGSEDRPSPHGREPKEGGCPSSRRESGSRMAGARRSHVFVRAPEAGKPVRVDMAWFRNFQLAACEGTARNARANDELPDDPETFTSRMNHNFSFQELLK